jgi:riboflavin kinase
VSDARPTAEPVRARLRTRGEELAVLKQLALAGADRAPLGLTSRQVGERIGASQQAADRYLVALEKQGYLTRTFVGRRPKLALTSEGIDALRAEYHSYHRIFDGPARVSFQGQVTSGLGEGRYYLSQPGYAEQFPPRVGYMPFPGTLNVRIEGEARRQVALVRHWVGIRIEGFHAGDRTFGGATCYVARLNDRPCHLIRPDRTHYDDVVEFVAPESLRETLHLADRMDVTVELEES